MTINCGNIQMGFKLSEIAEAIGGKVEGDPDKYIEFIAPFETANDRHITYAGKASFIEKIPQSSAGAIIVPEKVSIEGRNLIKAAIPYVAFAKVLQLFFPQQTPKDSISPLSNIEEGFLFGKNVEIFSNVFIGKRVSLGDRVRIMPGVYIGDDVKIGSDVTLYPNVTIMEKTIIGSRVIINAGTVIGSDGFGFAPDGHRYHKIPHTGFVQIDDDVELGANNTVDRGTFGRTWIKQGVKTDNLVQIAHNVTVGEHSVLVAQVGIAGSTTIGSHAVIAGQAGIAGHLRIGDRVTVGPQAGIAQDVDSGQIVSGSPEMPHRTWLKVNRIIPRLPEMRKKIRELEERLQKIENN